MSASASTRKPYYYDALLYVHYTRESQKVRGHFKLLTHLLNVFKFYFIFKKMCFHSLISANIKQITGVLPEKIDFEYARVSRSGTCKI